MTVACCPTVVPRLGRAPLARATFVDFCRDKIIMVDSIWTQKCSRTTREGLSRAAGGKSIFKLKTNGVCGARRGHLPLSLLRKETMRGEPHRAGRSAWAKLKMSSVTEFFELKY